METAQERNEQIFPSLIYTSGVIYSLISTATGGQPQAEEQGGGSVEANGPRAPSRKRDHATEGRRMEDIPAAPTGDRAASRRRVEGGAAPTDDVDSGFRSGAGGEWRNDERARIRQTRQFC